MTLQDQLRRSLGSKYTVERELGGAGMSRVFVAEETALGRKVVVKLLPADLLAGVSLERFNREILLAAKLQHPHIVPVLSAGEVDGLPYYTMPFVEGESLRARLAQNGPLPVGEAIGVLRDVAKALAYAHERGVVHRDVKPDNILLTGGSAAVTDFGIAKAISASRTYGGGETLTQVGTSIGTPAYMSPEQSAGDPATDHRTDIYAFGCLAYEVLTGRPPFADESPRKLLAAHMSATPEPVRALRPAMPESLADLVTRCLEKDPSARPGSAMELIRVLETTGTPAEISSLQRPRGRSIAIVVTVVAALAVAAYAALTRDRVERAPTLAVVPLDQAGADTSQRYLSDGITDEVTTALAQVPTLRVVARGSAYAFRGTSIDARKASTQLHVAQVLELGVQRRGDVLHVNADLVGGSDGIVHWSRSTDYRLNDLGSVRDSVAHDVVRALRVASSSRAPGHHPPREAAEMYLRGRYATDLSSRDDLTRAIGYFKRAEEIDSAYAEAYASEATAWTELADAYLPPVDCYPRADTLSRRALALDSTIAEAYANIGWVTILFKRDWVEAEKQFKRAIALNPNDALAHNYYGQALFTSGRFPEAEREIAESTRLDPSFVWFLEIHSAVFTMQNLPDSGIALRRLVDAVDPGFVYGEAFVADAWRLKGDTQRALAIDSAAAKVMGRPTSGLVVSLVRVGRRDDAERAFHEIETAREHQYIAAEVPARAALALGHRDRALYWFRRGIADHSLWASFVPWFPDVRPFVADTAYANVIRATGLSPEIFAMKHAGAGRP